MNQVNKTNTFIKYLLFIYLHIFLLYCINCDCSADCRILDNNCVDLDGTPGSCSSDCKVNLLSSEPRVCESCTGTSTDEYYLINSDSTCTLKSSCDTNEKIIDGSKQCISQCTSLYEKQLGEYCYSSLPENVVLEDASTNTYKCQYTYTITTTEGKQKYHCYGEDAPCPDNLYYDLITSACSDTACTQKTKIEYRSNSAQIRRCSDNCKENEFLYQDSTDGINYCVDSCPSLKPYYYEIPTGKICTNDCSSEYLYNKNGKCVEASLCPFTYNSQCVNSCQSTDKPYHDTGGTTCLTSCGQGDHDKKYEIEHVCYKECPSQFINTDQTNCISTTSKDNCFYVPSEDIDNNHKCYSICPNGNLYHNLNSKICLPNCQDGSNGYKYHKEGEYICYPSCTAIFVSGGDNIYENDYTCSNTPCTGLYIIDNGVKKCVNDEQECISKGLNYKNGNECVLSCAHLTVDYTEVAPGTVEHLGKCFDDVSKCKESGYHYYNIVDKKCWQGSCPSGMYPNQLDPSSNLPKVDNSGNTCTHDCTAPFPRLKDNICKENCGPDKYFVPGNNICQDSCGTLFVGENNECITECPYYYITDNSSPQNKICVPDCKNIYNKFFFDNDKKCYDSCTQGSTYYFYNSNNKCLETCIGNEGAEFAEDNTSGNKPCLPSPPYGKYYFDDKKIILGNCALYSSDNTKCVYNCEPGYKVYDNKCVPYCPPEAPNYISDSNPNPSISQPINKCVNGCTTTGKTKIIYSTKECTSVCPDYFNEINNICYSPCEGGKQYFNPNTQTCDSVCPPQLPYFELLTAGVYICKNVCNNGDNIYIDGGECVSSCSSNNNYIGEDNKCLSTCSGNESGELYIDTQAGGSYKIYKCISSCVDTGAIYYVQGNKECYRECPDHYKYVVQNTYECLPNCPNTKPYYISNPTPVPANGHITCSDIYPCTSTGTYFLDGECVSETDCTSDSKNYVENGICVAGCTQNNYYKKISTNPFYICKEICGGTEFIVGDHECVDHCPNGLHFVGNDKKCKAQCESDDGLYYHKLAEFSSPEQYKTYSCMHQCQGTYQYKTLNTNECYDECPVTHPYLSEVEKTCFASCLFSTINNLFSLSYEDPDTHNTISICSGSCRDPVPCYEEDKKCIASCQSIGYQIKDFDGKCVSQCNHQSTYKFEEDNECKQECTHNLRYSISDYKCKEACIYPNDVVVGNECRDSCENEQFFKKPITGTGGAGGIIEYECAPSCGNNFYYYENEKKCLTECNTGDYAFETSNICTDNCRSVTDIVYYFYETLGSSDIYYTVNTCVTKCPNSKPYAFGQYNETCVDKCPDEKRYYVKEFLHNEASDQKICLNDCPGDYQFYTIRKDASDATKKYYECQPSCLGGYYIPNTDINKNAKLCLPSCPVDTTTDTTYSNYTNYKYKIENIHDKTCYAICPTEKPYHTTESGSECLIQCPGEAPFHEDGDFVCKTAANCIGNFIDYETKTCLRNTVTQCLFSRIYTTSLSSGKTLCSNQCVPAYAQYATPYNTCVTDCLSVTEGGNSMNLKNDEANKKCICKNLYYIDELSFKMICLADNANCESTDYKIRMNGSNQCIKICHKNKKLSTNEDICYEESYNCPSNTILVSKSSQEQKCDCQFKYYIDGNTKTCLSQNAVCPVGHEKYVPVTMECVNSCTGTYSKSFKDFCLSTCPKGSTESGTTCGCGDQFWYETSRGNYECLEGKCLDSFPVYAEPTKQCLRTCKGSNYPILFENKCYHTCPFLNSAEVSITSDYANSKCDCLYPWYYDASHEIHCPTRDTISKCSEYNIDKDYMIKETRECVESCTEGNLYHFNKICYPSCQYANENYLLHIENDGNTFECKCQNLWYIDNGDKICYNRDINECEPKGHPSTAYLIDSTKECVDGSSNCPSGSYIFNHICYNECPLYTKKKSDTDYDCICDTEDGYWYEYQKHGNTYYVCGLKECPKTSVPSIDSYARKNLLTQQNKCVVNCLNDGGADNTYKYALRNICLEECPLKTITDVDECKFYNLNDELNIDTLEKLKDAANVQAKELYEEYGHLGGFVLSKYDASLQIYAIDKSNSLKQLSIKSNLTYIDFGTCTEKIFANYNLKDTDKIIVAKYDLLTRNSQNSNSNSGSDPSGGGSDPSSGGGDPSSGGGDPSSGGGDPSSGGGGPSSGGGDPSSGGGDPSSGGSSPSSGGGSSPSNTEVIDNKYLINQVEYELFSSKTMEKISASVCEPYEIVVSYPIFYNKNKFNNYEGGINQNEYKKKFDIGKELYYKNNKIDTFNFNNSVYKDICVGTEINGKDLVLEDRFEYLYPNNASLCESNCTMNNTDFDLERIVCLCTFKEILDFNRKEEDRNDLLGDPNFKTPTQSSSNMEVIKCLGKISIKDAIINNEAFYYCTVVVALEISMVFISAFSGFKNAFANISNLLNKGINNNDLKIDMNKINNNKKNKLNDSNMIVSSQRQLNNPPRKNTINEDNNNNIVNNEINNNNAFFDPNDNDESQISNNNKNKNLISNNNNYKAEYIPSQYNFKYFKLSDQGVKKKIERSKIPFEVDPDTKYLIERRTGVEYGEDYLLGPYLPTQNILEIIDSNPSNKNKNNNNEKYIRYSRNLQTNLPLYNTDDKVNDIDNIETIKIEQKNPKKKIVNNFIENTVNNNITNTEEKDFINVKKIGPKYKAEPRNNNLIDFNQNEKNRIKIDDNTTLYTLIKREQSYLRVTYEKYIEKKHPNVLSIFCAEIMDKIYFVKICLFLKKFEIFSMHFSLYLLYHLLLLTLICAFFTIKVIKKIWNESNFPGINFYLLYGLISNIIIWAIYKIFLCLLDIQDKVKEIVSLKNNAKYNNEIDNDELNDDSVNNKINELKKEMKIKMIIFYAILFALSLLSFIYLVSFFGIYTGTKSKVFTAYLISLIEIILIKCVYGICLASLRIASEGNEIKTIYKVVYICDRYIS